MAEPAAPDDAKAAEFVACGQPLPGHEIRIVDEAGFEVGERREGRLEFRGPSTTRGYFHNETKTRELFHNGWLDSADRAYMAGGDVYITGRIKDIIIRGGRHLYPQEIEEAVAEIPGIRKGGVAVFGVTDPATGTERVIVLAETRETDAAARAALQARAHEVTMDIAGSPPDEIVLAPPRTVPKTSSGRFAAAPPRSFMKAATSHQFSAPCGGNCSAWPCPGPDRNSHVLHKIARDAVYAGVVVDGSRDCCSVGIAGRACASASGLALVGTEMDRGRATLLTMGIPVSTVGVERIQRRDAMLVFNHSSYADRSCLWRSCRESRRSSPEGIVRATGDRLARESVLDSVCRALRRLREFADAQALVSLAREGRVLVFFPEGTFTCRAGLSAFYLGAFKVAVEADLAVLPWV